MSLDLKEYSISLLSTTTVSLAATGATTLYTVPTGKRCVLFGVLLIIGADASTSALTIGQQGALTDFLNTQTLSNLDAENDAGWLLPVPNATPVKIESYAAGTLIQTNVTTANGGSTNTMKLFGTLYDA